MDIVVLFIALIFFSYVGFNSLVARYSLNSTSYLWLLLAVHYLLTLAYILYAYATTSDSFAYYNTTSAVVDWFSLFGTGTTFIKFLAWPFVAFAGISYLSSMILFSYAGFWGILLCYLAAKEHMGFDGDGIRGRWGVLEWVFLLPNIHFWSSSLGKGSIIALALGLFVFALSRFNTRYLLLPLSGLLIYLVRPHIFFAALLGLGLGLLFMSSGVKIYLRIVLVAIAVGVALILSPSVMEFTEIDTINIFNSGTLSRRAQELSKSSSGIDISSYSPLAKLFTFWFRPLFFDANGLMGLIVSFENLFYIFLFGFCIRSIIARRSSFNGWFYICLIIYLIGSVLLSQVSGNLGIALRQKAQLMPLIFVFYAKAMAIYRSQLQRSNPAFTS